jgi:ParB family chromosome partitioning protein
MEQFVTVVTSLDRVQPNPYQTRLAEDPDHVARIAASILADGLLQAPVGRGIYDGHDGYDEPPNWVELAFGHTRLAAYRLLAREHPEFAAMPVVIRKLDARQMFELAVSENVQRKDLTPIEQAQAMHTARDQFKMTSDEIGQLFGTSGANVRQKMRLLDLPKPVQAQVSKGEITECAARSVLTVQKVAPAEAVALAERIGKNGSDAQSVASAVENTLKNAENVVTMHSVFYSTSEPCGGGGLWPLTWAVPAGMDANKIAGALALKKAQVVEICMDLVKSPETIAAEGGISLAQVEQVQILANPVPCKRCPLYIVSAGTHYCGFKSCHKWKKTEWLDFETRRLSAELGIPVLDPKTDGKEFEEITWQGESEKKFQEWFKERAAHLRLRPKLKEYDFHTITNSKTTELVSINQAYRDKLAKQKKAESEQKAKNKTDQQSQKEKEARCDTSKIFLSGVAAPVFASVFACLSESVVQFLINQHYSWEWKRLENKPQPVMFFAYMTIAGAVSYQDKYSGPSAVAKALKPLAETWGIHLPADWDAAARKMEITNVDPS